MRRLWSSPSSRLAVFGHVEAALRRPLCRAVRACSARLESAVLAGTGDEATCAAFGLARGERRAPEREFLGERVGHWQAVLATCAQAVVAQALLREGGDLARQSRRRGERFAAADDSIGKS